MGGYIACIIGGAFGGFILALFLNAKYFDKPEVTHQYNDKIKVRQKKGTFSNWFNRSEK